MTDLDGTLWGPDEIVHPATLRALRELEQRAIPVLVATGRSRRLAYSVLDLHGIVLDAALHDGTLGATSGGDLFHHHPFDEEAVAAVLSSFGRFDMEPILEVDDADVDFLAGEHPSVPRPLVRPSLTVDLRAALPMPVFRAIAAVGADTVEPLVRDLVASGAAEAWAAPTPSGDAYWLIARPASCSKWTATLSYCERAGIDAGAVLAVGDGNNDRELLAGAHVAVAVEGGAAGLLETADHLVGPPGDGGWAGILDLL